MGEYVKQKMTATKANVGAVIACVLAVCTALATTLPNNDTVQIVALVVGAGLTALATRLGVYQTENKPI